MVTRRQLLSGSLGALGTASLSALLSPRAGHAEARLHFPAKAKRVIWLFQSGAPSQLETFDHKPMLREMNGVELPASVRQQQRLTTMTSGQANFPIIASPYEFAQYGQSGAWVSELLPHTAAI